MIEFYELCVYIGGILFPISIIPQIYRAYKIKDLSNISYYWQLLFIIALILTLVYSLHGGLIPIIISSIIEIIFTIIIVCMKCYYNINNRNIDHNNPTSI